MGLIKIKNYDNISERLKKPFKERFTESLKEVIKEDPEAQEIINKIKKRHNETHLKNK